MLQVARLATKTLGDSASLVREFLLSRQLDDGGFADRAGRSDLYYSVFALDSLLALQTPPDLDHVQSFLLGKGRGDDLDFVHLSCLARGWAVLGNFARDRVLDAETRGALLRRLAEFRSADGGYQVLPGSQYGSAYGAFLALGAHQDLRAEIPEPLRLVQSLKFLETADGAWTNERFPVAGEWNKVGSTNATAAAVAVLRNLGMPVNASVGSWLLGCAHPEGGFRAMPRAPIPDLLSTATSLHALAGLQVSIDGVREACLDFIDTLWTNQGSFHGHWAEDALDTEYTFYGLLALGHLSV